MLAGYSGSYLVCHLAKQSFWVGPRRFPFLLKLIFSQSPNVRALRIQIFGMFGLFALHGRLIGTRLPTSGRAVETAETVLPFTPHRQSDGPDFVSVWLC